MAMRLIDAIKVVQDPFRGIQHSAQKIAWAEEAIRARDLDPETYRNWGRPKALNRSLQNPRTRTRMYSIQRQLLLDPRSRTVVSAEVTEVLRLAGPDTPVTSVLFGRMYQVSSGGRRLRRLCFRDRKVAEKLLLADKSILREVEMACTVSDCRAAMA